MSVLSVLVFISRGVSIRMVYSLKLSPDDAHSLELFARILVGQEKCPSKLSAALEQGIDLVWKDVYDFVNPFGDRRGGAFNSVWRFDLDNDVLCLTKEDGFYSVPLELARTRLLTLDDFKTLSSLIKTSPEEQSLPERYWERILKVNPRPSKFIGRILRDFSNTWRHVLRRRMNFTTFIKLAYATLWILKMEFNILDRVGFEHITSGGPYVQLVDLPSWETPEATLLQAGSSWFVLSQDAREGLAMVRHHISTNPTANLATHVILTLRKVIICKFRGDELVWTRPETLFDGSSVSNRAIDMLLWAINTTGAEPQPSTISHLPTEIQDRILHHATTSFISAAKLGCELGLGSPFSWVDRGVKISVEEVKRHRFEGSPVESQIAFNGVISGLSYKRERGYQAVNAN